MKITYQCKVCGDEPCLLSVPFDGTFDEAVSISFCPICPAYCPLTDVREPDWEIQESEV